MKDKQTPSEPCIVIVREAKDKWTAQRFTAQGKWKAPYYGKGDTAFVDKEEAERLASKFAEKFNLPIQYYNGHSPGDLAPVIVKVIKEAMTYLMKCHSCGTFFTARGGELKRCKRCVEKGKK